jgi:hypothetical protein
MQQQQQQVDGAEWPPPDLCAFRLIFIFAIRGQRTPRNAERTPLLGAGSYKAGY